MSLLEDSGVFLIVNKYLEPNDVVRLGTSSKYHFILSTSNAVWKPMYEEFMLNKTEPLVNSFLYKLSLSSSSLLTINYKYRYYIALWDSKRTFITIDEFVGHIFSFRFKEAAGDEWKHRDPWWKGNRAMTVKFNNDGTLSVSSVLSQIANDDNIDDDDDNDDNGNNGNNINEETEGDDINYNVSTRLRYELAWKRGAKEKKRHDLSIYYNISNFFDESNTNTATTTTTNVFSLCRLKSLSSPVNASSLSILAANTGNIVRIFVNDIGAPSYHIWRTPNHGVILESCWALYTSFKLPLLGESLSLEQLICTNESTDESLEDDNLTRDTLSQSSEVYKYNREVVLAW